LMSFSTFIFSEKRSIRIKRHILFWILWWLYFGALHAAKPFLKPESSFFMRTEFAFAESFLFMIPQIIIAYLILYFVLPMYTKRGKIVQPILWGIISWIACGAFNMYMIKEINPVILDWFLTDEQMLNTERLPENTFYMALMATWKGALAGTAFVVGIHYIK